MLFDQFQREVRAWQEKNFPTSTDNEPFHGIVEEIGELVASWLARRQLVEDFMDTTEATDNYKDAIADTCVFIADYCNKRRFRIETILHENGFVSSTTFAGLQWDASMSRCPRDTLAKIMIQVGNLAHSRLKRTQGIRGTAEQHVAAERQAIGEILAHLALLCQKGKFSLDGIVEETWAEVSKRDWTANRVTGQAEESPFVTRSTMPYES